MGFVLKEKEYALLAYKNFVLLYFYAMIRIKDEQVMLREFLKEDMLNLRINQNR